ncbi:cyclase family protein [Litorilinea aerophila]|uniref:Cyclase family protein n=1 Tax=Litorilinea aerophila TaxID=1204385 RepID=A0A540VIN8_9CHLR|nr:cyclase family protein [Litorilinea aerophila]MCC9076392.1 cyclase family protein [Litorilinea aerophila]OUC09166.1 cyclase [Litorilinea aerophila]GIV79124.1 MAG: cyclase [Litorilinea sp.]
MTTPATLLAQLVGALNQGQIQVVDLTQPLGPDTPVIELPPIFAQSPGLTVERISYYDDAGPMWYWNTIRLGEHTGTHFDAPAHWITGRDLPDNTTDTIPPRRFIGPACVVDVSREVAEDEDFVLTPDHVLAWERDHGVIPAGAWFLMRTDWSKRRGREAFLNVREDGAHSPGFTPECVRFLAQERDVLGVGVETVGTDAGQAANFDPPFPAHNIMQGAGKFGLASLCNLDQLPPVGAVVIAAPLKLVNGSGSPLRVLALVPGQA